MNTIEKRRLLHQRRTRKKGGGGAARFLLITFLGLASLGTIAAAAGVGALYTVYRSYADDYVPIETKLRQTNAGLTDIYDRNGIFLGSLTNPDSQLLAPVQLDAISKWVVEATVSTEDNTFFTNPGFNWRGLMRAAKENYVDGQVKTGSGGSSITQQLIKNVYICPSIVTSDEKVCDTGPERSVDRKVRELAYAIELENDYSKEQILQWYLNQISYADRYIGIQAAAQGYFRKDAADLTLAESALLAGVPQFPGRYHPRISENCEQDADGNCLLDGQGRTTLAGDAKQRQEAVLELMVEHSRATRAEVDAAKAEPVLIYSQTNPIRAAAWIDNQVEPRLVRMCDAKVLKKSEKSTDCSSWVHSAGLRVTTTLDIAETEVALQVIRGAIETGLVNGCNCYNAAIGIIDPKTGQVLVYAPNRDPSYVSDPRVAGKIDQLVEINQPGSSFKPFVYLAWFDRNQKAPMSTFWDTSPLKVEGVEIRNPRNDGKSGEGMISARAALGGSQNVGAFRAAYEAGTDDVIDVAKKMGITTLEQHFDPTFSNHDAVTYGASIATGGANIRAIDLAYANSVIANMGVMVGVPTYAKTVALKDLKSKQLDEGEAYDLARKQAVEFSRGNIRIPGTRELDPVTVLRVETKEGEILYDHETAKDLQKKQVMDAGSVWLVHSIISDCTSRFIIWGCGGSNSDLALDPFMDGTRIPGGAKTGTQQGPKTAEETLETWMNGYSRDAAMALWVGNANNELVRDGPQASYAAANTTVRLFKTWMGEYHSYLTRTNQIKSLRGFDEIRPKNVAQVAFLSPATDRGLAGGCTQTVTSWVRTDVKYASECETREIDTRNGLLASEITPAAFRATKGFVKLPGLKPDLAIIAAKEFKIPIAPTDKSTGQQAVAIVSPANGKTVNGPTPIVGSVGVSGGWKLELGEGAGPATWKQLAAGNDTVTDKILATIDSKDLAEGVYTARLTTTSGLSTSVTFNVSKTPVPTPTPTPRGGQTPTAVPPRTPTPVR